MTVVIEPSTDADVPAMVSPLITAGLPSEGLVDHLANALVGREGMDPKGQPPDRVRAIRDDIRQRVGRVVEREGWFRNDGLLSRAGGATPTTP